MYCWANSNSVAPSSVGARTLPQPRLGLAAVVLEAAAAGSGSGSARGAALSTCAWDVSKGELADCCSSPKCSDSVEAIPTAVDGRPSSSLAKGAGGYSCSECSVSVWKIAPAATEARSSSLSEPVKLGGKPADPSSVAAGRALWKLLLSKLHNFVFTDSASSSSAAPSSVSPFCASHSSAAPDSNCCAAAMAPASRAARGGCAGGQTA
mmetsp:Transcript_71808/g.206111  ORF Transcript_71808/g.206111 Transcript_71808/m.206111 type:complete len:208 (-) Transcript_71808:6-629(-)